MKRLRKSTFKASSRTAVVALVRVRCGKSLGGDRALWVDLHGCSHAPLAYRLDEAKRAAKDLRKLARWLETDGINYLQHGQAPKNRT